VDISFIVNVFVILLQNLSFKYSRPNGRNQAKAILILERSPAYHYLVLFAYQQMEAVISMDVGMGVYPVVCV
jgi:hypothetical protein